ncbi:hypothetical protein E4656_01150 [Natronospirillum operosum]|uniref:Uncharacterized protein n=1 Tax=Natronospirillum operosum TaxID=2759953 RepID=A0A4Z0WH29_9GAMM|nr:hypothetical protein [Natronospirillum operosum]TGG95066.1 hypothetical protein E4656_01150 [Natronospirillum operosum]
MLTRQQHTGSRMRKLGRKARQRTDEQLAEREQAVLQATAFDWEAIKPALSDAAEQQLLMEAVAAATARNESVGQVVERLKKLGEKGEELAELPTLLPEQAPEIGRPVGAGGAVEVLTAEPDSCRWVRKGIKGA